MGWTKVKVIKSSTWGLAESIWLTWRSAIEITPPDVELQNYCFAALVRARISSVPHKDLCTPGIFTMGGIWNKLTMDSCLESGLILFQVGLSVIVYSFNKTCIFKKTGTKWFSHLVPVFSIVIALMSVVVFCLSPWYILGSNRHIFYARNWI